MSRLHNNYAKIDKERKNTPPTSTTPQKTESAIKTESTLCDTPHFEISEEKPQSSGTVPVNYFFQKTIWWVAVILGLTAFISVFCFKFLAI